MASSKSYFRSKKPCLDCTKLIGKNHLRCCSCNQARFKKSPEEKLRVKRLCARNWSKAKDKRLKVLVFIKLGSKCASCGFSDPRALHIDHVNDDGYLDRKNKNWNPCVRNNIVLQDTSGRFQILCANCNYIKLHELMQKKDLLKYGQV